ncbi:MAG: molybdopterin-dependent oxidoreductase [Flexilinea sp.]
MKIQINLNSVPVLLEVEANEALSDVLRRAGCYSLKHGCRTGECGSCSILFDGKLVSSCIILAPQADGHSIVTNEGLTEGKDLHPIQRAFIETGAIQCGYCTNGMILATKALLDKEKYPDLMQARQAIGSVLCRCTGYKKPVEAVMVAAAYLRGESAPDFSLKEKPTESYFDGSDKSQREARVKSIGKQEKEIHVVGSSAKKVDGYKLAKGNPAFVDDILLPGLLHAALLRSPYAHARIREIDTTKAKALPGVRAVLCYKDVPRVVHASGGQSWPNPKPWDQVSLDNKVRYVGDRVAIVAADTLTIAQQALELIDVDYEILPAVYDSEEAMKDGAPIIHDEPDAVGIKDAKHNIVTTLFAEIGDVDKVYAESDYKFDRNYSVQQVQQASLEGHISITWFDSDNRLVVRTSTQVPYHLRRMLSPLIGIPVSRIHVIKPNIGGGFGAKQEMVMEDLCALLTIETGKPIRLAYTREMELMSTRSRHPAKINFKVGVSKDGYLKSMNMKVIEDTGSYGTQGMTVCNVIGTRGLASYRCENERFYADVVYTNKPTPAAFRGYGGPQGLFALESLMDEIADTLKIDPIEFRAKNVNRLGDQIPIMSEMGEAGPTPQGIDSWGLPECVDRAGTAIDWKRRKDPNWKIDSDHPNIRRGLGMSFIMHGTNIPGLDMGGAVIKMNDDGSCNLMVGATDLGTGSDTILGQIAAETIGLTMDKIIVYSSDTDVTPFDVGAYASSTTFVSGNAVRKAAEVVRDMVYDRASIILKCSKEGMTSYDNMVFAADGRSISIEAIALNTLHSMDQYQIMGTASHVAHCAPPSFGAQFAEVEVDIETGQVVVKKLALCVDCGTVMNPTTAIGQMDGGQTQALGYAVSENMTYDDLGALRERRFGDYHIFQAEEMPEIQSILINNYEISGPYGAKGLGEIPIDGVGQAVANAVYDAVGVRIYDLPILPEKVWAKLHH